MIQPATIQLIAPSGWPDADAARRGIDRLRHAGHQVLGEDCIHRRYLRFAGSDVERADEINRLADPEQPLPDIVMAVRGGYGAHRLLDKLDYDGLRRRLSDQPMALVGHSDITALSMALYTQAELITFAGPMLAYDFGGQTTSAFTLDQFWGTLQSTAHKVRWGVRKTTAPINVIGTLWGGNLAVLCSLLGTPYMPDIDRGILFLEDIFEPVYRIERLLYQLKLSGVLDRQRALLLGDFSGCRSDEYDAAYTLSAVVQHIRSLTDVPIIGHLPFGHCRDKLTLPVGSRAHLRMDDSGTVELSFTGYPHVTPSQATLESNA